MSRREFHCTEGNSSKFWAVTLEGKQYTIQFGKIGSKGQTQVKTSADEAAAQKAVDTLIAEKVKKGYTEVGAAKAAPAAPTASEEPPAPAEVQVKPALAVTHTIELKPRDSLWLRSEKREVKPKRPPRLFDRNASLAKVAGMEYKWGWPLHMLSIPNGISPEEAWFWLTVIAELQHNDQTPVAQGALPRLSQNDFSRPPSVESVKQLVARRNTNVANAHIYRLLATLVPVGDLVEIISDDHRLVGAQPLVATRWFAEELLPFLTDQEWQAMAEVVRSRLATAVWSTTHHAGAPIAFYLASLLGLCKEVQAVVAGWSDDLFRKEEWLDRQLVPQFLIFGLGDRGLIDLHMRRLRLPLRDADQANAWLAITGLDGLDLIRKQVIDTDKRTEAETFLEVLCRVKPPEAAPHILEAMVSSKAPRLAREWLDTQPGNAIAGLIPVAAGRGKIADAAIEYLREAKRKGHADFIAEQLQSATPEAANKIRKDVLDRIEKVYTPFDDASTPDWLAPLAGLVRKPITWVQPASLPPVVVGEHCLNETQVRGLLDALRTPGSSTGTTEGMLKALRQHGDPASLDAFVWRLFELWLVEGAPPKEKWALLSLGWLGGDPCALKLTPLIRVWPGESQHQRAVSGLECLRAIGTDTALMQLNGIAQKLKFKGLQNKAREFMSAIAKDRGMTAAELEDRIVPDLDLDEKGGRTFDFGPRKFQLALDADLKPMVRDETGKLRADLPKPGAKDDADKANAAVADWKLLKKQLREVVKLQVIRLEQAMVTARRWPAKDFEPLLARHPLMTHLVRRLLWGRYNKKGKLLGTFRVTEDMALADQSGETVQPAENERIGLVHPLHLDTDDKTKWSEVFTDYEILPPFPQLGRPVQTLEPAERESSVLSRGSEISIPAVALAGTLERLGWQRGTPMDGGVYHNFSKQFPGANVTAVLAFEEGIPIGYMEGWSDQNVTGCLFLAGLRGPFGYVDLQQGKLWGENTPPLKLGDVDPVVMSEALVDLTTLLSKGTA